jgi:centromere protein I
VTLEEIENVNEFVDKLEKIELPNQLVAAIGDPLLQKFLQLRPSDSTSQRIDQWLLAFFEDQLETSGSEKAILEMLEAVRGYTNHTKVCSCNVVLRPALRRPRICHLLV